MPTVDEADMVSPNPITTSIIVTSKSTVDVRLFERARSARWRAAVRMRAMEVTLAVISLLLLEAAYCRGESIASVGIGLELIEAGRSRSEKDRVAGVGHVGGQPHRLVHVSSGAPFGARRFHQVGSGFADPDQPDQIGSGRQ